MKRDYNVWGEAEIDALRDMALSGITIPYIARALNRAPGSVRNKLYTLGVLKAAKVIKNAEIKVRVSDEERDIIRLAAKKDNRSISEFVRKAASREAAAIIGDVL